MRISSVRAGMAVATAATLLAGMAAATAEGAPASTVSTLVVGSAGSSLKISGNALLAAVAGTVVAEDAAGDSRAPGTDIVGGSITPLGGGVTRFTMDVANMGPGGATLPGVLHHSWDLTVVNGDKATEVALKAINGGAVNYAAESSDTSARSFAVQNCSPDPQTGQNTCTSTYITGAFSDKGVSFDVPNTLVGLQSGSQVISGENGMYTNLGASDFIWFSGPNGTEGVTHDDYVVPAGDVKVGLAPAGTAVEDVLLTATAPVKGKAYSALVPKPAPGSYVVVAQACHGGVCGEKLSKVVTVS